MKADNSIASAAKGIQAGVGLGKGAPGVGLLKHVLILAILLGLTVLLMGGFWVFKGTAPIPGEVKSPSGEVLATASDIKGGQAVYQKYGLMDYGSVLGHGAYLGEDFTARSLHLMVGAMRDFYAQEGYQKNFDQLGLDQQAAISARVARELKQNRYDAAKNVLILNDAQVYALKQLRGHYAAEFTNGNFEEGLPARTISENDLPRINRAWVGEGSQLTQISDFFFWTAWLSAARRPDTASSYTNNWPFEAGAGNVAGWNAVLWSAASVALLVLMLGVIFYIYQRYNFHMEQATEGFPEFQPDTAPIYESQRKTAKYFVVVVLLFLAQSLLGGLLSHYYVQGNSFYGLNIAGLLPFNIARSWHLQTAIFWIATAWLATGLFLAPALGKAEPKRQGLLVDILFGALVIVVAGSLLGEWLGTRGYLGNLWWLLGQQGWEYLELGRIWQVLLAAGLAIWLVLMFRGIRGAMVNEGDRGGLTHLLFYSAVAIPLFYGAAFFINPGVNITYADYWRWWVIHLWVEGIFEVFAVVVMGFLMVGMGLVTYRSTLRALYFQLTILLASGIIGTGHHYYWIGAPSVWIGLGAVFSALEVIPLTLLVWEAYQQYKAARDGGRNFPYRATFWFLTASGIWNLLGAGVLGFLINLPVINYFEHGSFLTAAHGHGAMAGVYGMFAIALLLYSMRNITVSSAWNEKLLRLSVWGLNLGLVGMIVITLLPVGIMQLGASYNTGFWFARSLAFYREPLVNALLWLRLIPDTVFIVLGVLPLVYVVIKAALNTRPVIAQVEKAGEKAGHAARVSEA